ncbi:hypothetical protein AOLI_G00302880 [Acnodon oligacanthus]
MKEEFWTVPEGTSEVPNMEAPAGKRMKRAVNRPRRTTKPDAFASNYMTGEKLGEGGSGSVFKGRRISDGLQTPGEHANSTQRRRWAPSRGSEPFVLCHQSLLEQNITLHHLCICTCDGQ